MVSAIDQAIGSKALPPDAAKIAEMLNREGLPVLRRLRALANRRATDDFGDGISTAFAFDHGFGTDDVTWSVRDNATGAMQDATTIASVTSLAGVLTVTMLAPPTANQYRVVILG